MYTPIAFLLSNIGTYFIGGLLIVLGLLLMSSYSVYDLYEQAVAAFRSFMENGKFVARSALPSVKKRGYFKQKQRRLPASSNLQKLVP